MENNNPTMPPPPPHNNPQQGNPYQQTANPYQQAPGGYQNYNQQPFGGMPVDLPGAGAAQVCGIIGIILFFNLIGIILNIIAVVKGSGAVREYQNNPGRYTEASFRKAKAGKTCGVVGLCLFGGGILIVILIAIAANM